MSIRSESELVWHQTKKFLYFIITLPWHLIEILIHPYKLAHKLERFFAWFKEPIRWFFETKVTAWLILLNIVAFFVSFTLSEELITSMVLYPESLLAGNILSLITSGFLHADIWHLLGNMLVLLIMGRVVERQLGTKGILLVYFGSLIISGLSSALIYLFVYESNVGAVGASGAISGVTSTAILLSPFYMTYLMFGLPLPIMLIGWLFITQDVFAILNPVPGDNVGHLAHLGGYIAIMLLVFFLAKENKKKLAIGFIVNGLIVILTLIVYNLWLAGSIPFP